MKVLKEVYVSRYSSSTENIKSAYEKFLNEDDDKLPELKEMASVINEALKIAEISRADFIQKESLMFTTFSKFIHECHFSPTGLVLILC